MITVDSYRRIVVAIFFLRCLYLRSEKNLFPTKRFSGKNILAVGWSIHSDKHAAERSNHN